MEAERQESGMPETIQARLDGAEKVLIGLGEEWKISGKPEKKSEILKAYEALYEIVKDKDYFIITMATDAAIYETALGSRQEMVFSSDTEEPELMSCPAADEETMAVMDRLFPPKKIRRDSRWERIVAPCGNETWRQCSESCTKDIWEPGEIPDDICPHCGAPLTGNTIDAASYIEEGYLPQWNRYTRWLTGTLNRKLVILELGVGFANPGVIRFPFEKTAFFNQKSFMYRVNGKFPQITSDLKGRSESVAGNSVAWASEYFQTAGIEKSPEL